MLGRKAILHTARQGKRKWQLEQEKDSGNNSSDESSQGEHDDEVDQQKARDEEPTENQVDKEDSGGGEEERKRRKRFAWMDSDDEVSDGDDDEAFAKSNDKDATVPHAAGANCITQAIAGRQPCHEDINTLNTTALETSTSTQIDMSFPPLPPPNLSAGSLALPLPAVPRLPVNVPVLPGIRPLMMRSAQQTSMLLPPGIKLPPLSHSHLELMAEIGVLRTLGEIWELIDKRSEEFYPAHASTSLHRLSILITTNGISPDMRLEKNKSFLKLRDRLDELLATPEGRASFMPADLALAAASLAKVVQLPATTGAIGRIFADIADEAETRIAVEVSAFTPPMIGDLVWGISKSGNARGGFLKMVIDVAKPRLPEMTCQDLANLASAYAEQSFEEVEALLGAVFDQVKQRLAYQPQATNALFTSVVSRPLVMQPQQPSVPPPPPPVCRGNTYVAAVPVALTQASAAAPPTMSTSLPLASTTGPITGEPISESEDSGLMAVVALSKTETTSAAIIDLDMSKEEETLDTPIVASVNSTIEPPTTKVLSTLCSTTPEEKQANAPSATSALPVTSSPAPLPPPPPPPPGRASVLAPITSVTTQSALVVPPERPPVWQSAGQWKFNGAQITDVVCAVSKHVGLYDEALFAKIVQEFLPRLQEFTAQHLQRMRDSFDLVRHDSDVDFLRALRIAIKQRECRRRCNAFKLGNCKFGDRCSYSHVL